MTDWRVRLREDLRGEGDERLSVDEVDAMRRAVLGSVRAGHSTVGERASLRPLALTATLVAMLCVGIAFGERFTARSPSVATEAERRGAGDSPPRFMRQPSRQLQFATPGGTRIIWVFNSELELRTMP